MSIIVGASVSSTDTNSDSQSEETPLCVIELLRAMTLWQMRSIEYQGLYTSYLMGCITESEFKKEAESFMIPRKPISVNKLIEDIRLIEANTDMTWSTSEYADLFQCDEKIAAEAIRILRKYK